MQGGTDFRRDNMNRHSHDGSHKGGRQGQGGSSNDHLRDCSSTSVQQLQRFSAIRASLANQWQTLATLATTSPKVSRRMRSLRRSLLPDMTAMMAGLQMLWRFYAAGTLFLQTDDHSSQVCAVRLYTLLADSLRRPQCAV